MDSMRPLLSSRPVRVDVRAVSIARPNREVPARTDRDVDCAKRETKPATGRGSNVPFCCGVVVAVVVLGSGFSSCNCRCFSFVFAMVIFSGIRHVRIVVVVMVS